MNAQEFLRMCILLLANRRGEEWASLRCDLQMEFLRKFHRDFVFSSRASMEFPAGILHRVCENDPFKPEPGYTLGEYDLNFNRWLKEQTN